MRAVASLGCLLACAIAWLYAPRAVATECLVRTFDLPHTFIPQAVPVDPFGGTFPGAIQWTSIPDPSCDPVVFEVRTELDATPIDVEIVRTGPLLIAWRVPDVAAGTIVGARQSCDDGTSRVYAAVQVTEGAPIERATPTVDALTETGTASLEQFSGCDETFEVPDVETISRVTTTLFAASVTTTDPAAVLVDAWLLDVDGELPGESDDRAADAVPVVLDDGRVLLRTELGGTRDLAVRIVDRDTAQASEVQRVSFTGPGQEIVGCTCSTSSSTIEPLLLALVFFFFRRAHDRLCPRRRPDDVSTTTLRSP